MSLVFLVLLVALVYLVSLASLSFVPLSPVSLGPLDLMLDLRLQNHDCRAQVEYKVLAEHPVKPTWNVIMAMSIDSSCVRAPQSNVLAEISEEAMRLKDLNDEIKEAFVKKRAELARECSDLEARLSQEERHSDPEDVSFAGGQLGHADPKGIPIWDPHLGSQIGIPKFYPKLGS